MYQKSKTMKKVFLLGFVALAFSSCDEEKDEVVEPQTVLHQEINTSFSYTSPLNVDVNGDDVDDFTFRTVLVSNTEGVHNLFFIGALQRNQVLLDLDGEISIGNWAAALQLNEMVQEDLAEGYQWVRTKGFVLDRRTVSEENVFSEGPLAEQNTLYVGIRLREGEIYKTGWVKLSYTGGSDEVKVIETVLYNATSQPIKAGQR